MKNLCNCSGSEEKITYNKHGIKLLKCRKIHADVSPSFGGHYLLHQGLKTKSRMSWNHILSRKFEICNNKKSPPRSGHWNCFALRVPIQPCSSLARATSPFLVAIWPSFLQKVAPTSTALRKPTLQIHFLAVQKVVRTVEDVSNWKKGWKTWMHARPARFVIALDNANAEERHFLPPVTSSPSNSFENLSFMTSTSEKWTE